MSDPKPLFWILDDGSNAGSAPRQIVVGDSPAAKNGILGFSFRDSSGNVVLPQLNSAGQLPVTSDSSGVFMSDNGEVAAGSATLVDVATITLTTSKTYIKLSGLVSCFREALFQFQQIDDVTTTVIAEVIVGPGQYTFEWMQPEFEIASGASGTQTFKVQAKNLDKLSSLRATLGCIEVAA